MKRRKKVKNSQLPRVAQEEGELSHPNQQKRRDLAQGPRELRRN